MPASLTLPDATLYGFYNLKTEQSASSGWAASSALLHAMSPAIGVPSNNRFQHLII